jgi:hypothetical protein
MMSAFGTLQACATSQLQFKKKSAVPELYQNPM